MYSNKIFMALIIAAMSTIATFGQILVAPPANPPAGLSPTGSWEGVVTSDGGSPSPFRVLMNFTADGGFTGSGDGDSAVGSPQYGVWERIGGKSSRKYSVTFRQLLYDPPTSTPTGYVRMQQTVILNESGDSWKGPFVVKIYLPDGTLVATGTGTSTASRIISEPLP